MNTSKKALRMAVTFAVFLAIVAFFTMLTRNSKLEMESAKAQSIVRSNTGSVYSGPNPNSLTPLRSKLDPNTVTVAMRMLYAPSEADDSSYRAAIASFMGPGSVVDYFDARAATPTLALLQTYNCVYTWADFAYSNRVTFGNTLADYVDSGGHVILGVFCTYTTGNSLGGRIMTSGYSPVTSPAGNNHFANSSYASDGRTCIYSGLIHLSCAFRDFLTLQGTGVKDGSYLDGEICHAYRPDFKVVYSNGSGASQLGSTGDWAHVISNACMCPGQTEPAFNFCVQDDATHDYIEFSSVTGVFVTKQCSTGFVAQGTGTVTTNGSTITLTANGPSNFSSATVDTSTHTGSAAIRVVNGFSIVAYNISDSNTNNNTCSCP